MMDDLVIRGGLVVTPEGLRPADVAITGEEIVAVGPELSRPAREEIDARGMVILPGAIDVHVHFNEPGRTSWEGIWHGSRALAAGGGVLFVDMPLNSVPPVLHRDAFEQKRQAAERAALTDFAFWGGIVPGNLPQLPELAAAGVIGFKAFLTDSGIPEFPMVDEETLGEGMRIAAALGLPVAVHAEDAELIRAATAHALQGSDRSARAYTRSRPVEAEVRAIQKAVALAEETGCALHLVHVSTWRGVQLAWEARRRGVDVSVETCPHYLLFTEDDLETLGTRAKCAPPLRSTADREGLWEAVRSGMIALVASDHSPAPPELKCHHDFFQAWGGIDGVQFTVVSLLTAGTTLRAVGLETVAWLTATGPAERFRLGRRGRIAEGYLADLVLVERVDEWRPTLDDVLTRHRLSPYVGYTFRWRVRRTIRRGATIFRDGYIVEAGGGRLIRPEREG